MDKLLGMYVKSTNSNNKKTLNTQSPFLYRRHYIQLQLWENYELDLYNLQRVHPKALHRDYMHMIMVYYTFVLADSVQ